LLDAGYLTPWQRFSSVRPLNSSGMTAIQDLSFRAQREIYSVSNHRTAMKPHHDFHSHDVDTA
jgi:hypothetical protein